MQKITAANTLSAKGDLKILSPFGGKYMCISSLVAWPEISLSQSLACCLQGSP